MSDDSKLEAPSFTLRDLYPATTPSTPWPLAEGKQANKDKQAQHRKIAAAVDRDSHAPRRVPLEAASLPGRPANYLNHKFTVIAVYNNKGGVGKTSVARAYAWSLASRGHRVLEVDADPQGDMTELELQRTAAAMAGGSVVALTERINQLHADLAPNPGGEPRPAEARAYQNRNQGAMCTLGKALLRVRREGGLTPACALSVVQFENKGSLGLVCGDATTQDFEALLHRAWDTNKTDTVMANVVGAFWHLLRMTAHKYNTEYVIVDMAPGIGFMNRTILCSTDYYILACDAGSSSVSAIHGLAKRIPCGDNTDGWLEKGRSQLLDTLQAGHKVEYYPRWPEPTLLGVTIFRFRTAKTSGGQKWRRASVAAAATMAWFSRVYSAAQHLATKLDGDWQASTAAERLLESVVSEHRAPHVPRKLIAVIEARAVVANLLQQPDLVMERLRAAVEEKRRCEQAAIPQLSFTRERYEHTTVSNDNDHLCFLSEPHCAPDCRDVGAFQIFGKVQSVSQSECVPAQFVAVHPLANLIRKVADEQATRNARTTAGDISCLSPQEMSRVAKYRRRLSHGVSHALHLMDVDLPLPTKETDTQQLSPIVRLHGRPPFPPRDGDEEYVW